MTIVYVMLSIASLWLLLRVAETLLIFRKTRPIEKTPGDFGLEFEDVYFMAEDGVKLHGWWVPKKEALGSILLCHGNAGNITTRAWMTEGLHEMGFNVLLFDYRGYGNSLGWPTEKGLYKDARAAYEVIRARHNDMENPPIIVIGRSLGGGVASQLALEKPIKALVIESSFTSMPAMCQVRYPFIPNFLCRYRFETIKRIKNISVPILLAHSREDSYIPYRMSEELFAMATEPKQWCDLKGSHRDAGWGNTPVFYNQLKQFLQTHCNK